METEVSVSSKFRSRVVGLRTVRASELRRNPKNWRVHPTAQQELMRGLLKEVGFVGALVARETPDGLELIDGHLRSDLAEDAEVPVLIVDLSDEEAEKVLLTFDPVSGMAASNDQLLRELLERAKTQNAEIRHFLSEQERKLGDEELLPEPDEAARKREVPGMGLEPHEHYDYLVVLCTTTNEWNILCDRLKLEPVERRGRMGTGRAIRAEQLLPKLGVQES